MNLSVEFVPGTWDGDTFIEPKLVVKALTGTFEEAKPIIEKLLADLNQQGIKLEFETPIEKHTHGPDHLTKQVTKRG